MAFLRPDALVDLVNWETVGWTAAGIVAQVMGSSCAEFCKRICIIGCGSGACPTGHFALLYSKCISNELDSPSPTLPPSALNLTMIRVCVPVR